MSGGTVNALNRKAKSATRHSSLITHHSSLITRRFHFVITAGPTREHLDPVRFLSNPSTGKMGFAVARAAAERGHDVTLIAGPVALKTPKGVRRVDVVSAREMLAASETAVSRSSRKARTSRKLPATNCRLPTIFISTAAVADWRPAKCAAKKMKKSQMSDTLHLVRNPDILRTLRKKVKLKGEGEQRNVKPFIVQPPTFNRQPLHLVGFAAETDDVLAEASRKCREKGLSFIVANDVTQKGSGFGTDTNRVTFVFPDGTTRPLPLMSKLSVARRIIRECENLGL